MHLPDRAKLNIPSGESRRRARQGEISDQRGRRIGNRKGSATDCKHRVGGEKGADGDRLEANSDLGLHLDKTPPTWAVRVALSMNSEAKANCPCPSSYVKGAHRVVASEESEKRRKKRVSKRVM